MSEPTQDDKSFARFVEEQGSLQPQSACCGAPVRISSADEGTAHYRCTGCGEPCDVPTVSLAPEVSWDGPSLSGDGMNPQGHVCSNCAKREATMACGDFMTINHGGGSWRCEVCALEEQIPFARERAEALPAMEARLAELLAAEA